MTTPQFPQWKSLLPPKWGWHHPHLEHILLVYASFWTTTIFPLMFATEPFRSNVPLCKIDAYLFAWGVAGICNASISTSDELLCRWPLFLLPRSEVCLTILLVSDIECVQMLTMLPFPITCIFVWPSINVVNSFRGSWFDLHCIGHISPSRPPCACMHLWVSWWCHTACDRKALKQSLRNCHCSLTWWHLRERF